MTKDNRVAVVTGASQGIGLETARQLAEQGFTVVLTGRDIARIETATKSISGKGKAIGRMLDVSDDVSVDGFFDWLAEALGRLDVLINNAGRIYAPYDRGLADTTAKDLAEALNNNSLSAWRMMRKAVPMMNARGYGRVVNLSSGMGALSEMGGGAVPYRVSKTAMNALTVIASKEAENNVKINTVCPGWVRTEMGGPNARRDISEGAKSVMWAATLDEDGPNGGFFRDGKPLDW